MKLANKSGLGFKNFLIAFVIAVLAGAITYTFVGDNSTKPTQEKAAVKIIAEEKRKVVPNLDVDSYFGDAIEFETGKVVVLNFWASWCAPCRAETPLLVEIAKDFPEVQFIGLTNSDTEEAALSFADQFGITYEIGNGDAYLEELSQVQQIFGLPTTLVLDEKQRIAARVIGEISEAEFREALSTLTTN